MASRQGLHLDPRGSARAPEALRIAAQVRAVLMIKQELTPAEIAFVESHRDADTFPEMELVQNQRRLYPRNGLAAHVIGYVGEVSEQELDTPASSRNTRRAKSSARRASSGNTTIMLDGRGRPAPRGGG